jgi:hypothetical protein
MKHGLLGAAGHARVGLLRLLPPLRLSTRAQGEHNKRRSYVCTFHNRHLTWCDCSACNDRL